MTHKTQPTAHAEITAPISADLRRIDDAGAQLAPVQPLESLTADKLAELCEQWLQAGGASNIVDAYEAGFRSAERLQGEVIP